MADILPDKTEKNEFNSSIHQFMTQFKVGTLLNQSNIRKEDGVSATAIVTFLFAVAFHGGKSMNQLLNEPEKQPGFKKDTVNRFLKNEQFNWRKFLILFSSKVIATLIPYVKKDDERVLILDDSLYSRNRSKKVELLARNYDHASGKYMKGFRMLTLGWSDGHTFIPLAKTFLSSKEKAKRLTEVDDRIDKRTVGYKRRQEAQKKATETLFDLLSSLPLNQLKAKTILFDSWFGHASVIKRVVTDYSLDVICMIKPMRAKYGYEGKQYTLKGLYAHLRKKRGRAIVKAEAIVSLGQNDKGEDIQAKIIFVKNRNVNGKRNWLALLSTDTEMDNKEIIRLYGKRWGIETFFKYCKSYLQLGKEVYGRKYDIMIAHTSIVFMRYIFFALASRNEQDPRTIGELFYLECDELENIRFTESLSLLLDALKELLEDEFVLSEQQVTKLLDQLIDTLPSKFKDILVGKQPKQRQIAA